MPGSPDKFLFDRINRIHRFLNQSNPVPPVNPVKFFIELGERNNLVIDSPFTKRNRPFSKLDRLS